MIVVDKWCGTMWGSEIDDVIERRQAARVVGDYAEADRLRDLLSAKEIILEDRYDGTTQWRRK